MKTLSKVLAAIAVAAVSATAVIPAGVAVAAPQQSRFQNHGDYGTYNNYRGDRNRHAGYQFYNGFWFPPAAFVAGAIVGGLLSQPAAPQTYTYSYAPSDHLAYCQQRFRSYNVATDSYFGYDNQYHRCISPDQYQYGQ